MKILLIGANGNMGREVISVCKDTENEIIAGVDRERIQIGELEVYDSIKFIQNKPDVIIDFSTCEDRGEYIKYAMVNQVPYCCFSTIISNSDIEKFQELSHFTKVLICSNTSKGMNALLDMLEIAKTRLYGADVVISEYHHRLKKDAPSGSAKKIIATLKPIFPNLQISAFRVGSEKGLHKVEFFFEEEVVEISHRVLSRRVFALGAIDMAKRLLNKSHGIYYRI